MPQRPPGRLVMEATCTPGLPTVVTTLVRLTSRPAAAPFSTRMDAGTDDEPSPPKPEELKLPLPVGA